MLPEIVVGKEFLEPLLQRPDPPLFQPCRLKLGDRSLDMLAEADPAIIGGKLPDDGFYL